MLKMKINISSFGHLKVVMTQRMTQLFCGWMEVQDAHPPLDYFLNWALHQSTRIYNQSIIHMLGTTTLLLYFWTSQSTSVIRTHHHRFQTRLPLVRMCMPFWNCFSSNSLNMPSWISTLLVSHMLAITFLCLPVRFWVTLNVLSIWLLFWLVMD